MRKLVNLYERLGRPARRRNRKESNLIWGLNSLLSEYGYQARQESKSLPKIYGGTNTRIFLPGGTVDADQATGKETRSWSYFHVLFNVYADSQQSYFAFPSLKGSYS